VALVAASFFGLPRFVVRLFPPLLLRFNLNKVSALMAIFPFIFYTFIAGLGVAAVVKKGTLRKIIKNDNKREQWSSSKILRGLERLFWFPIEPIARRRYFVPAASSFPSFEG